MDQAVDGGYRHARIGEHVVPAGERLVGRDEDAAPLVALGDQFEQHAGLGLVPSDIREVVKNEQVVAVQLCQCLGQLQALARGLKIRIVAPFSSQASPLANAMTWALESMGTSANLKLASVLVGSSCDSVRWRSMPRLARSASSCSSSAPRKRPAGQPSLSERSANCDHSRPIVGKRNSPSISAMR